MIAMKIQEQTETFLKDLKDHRRFQGQRYKLGHRSNKYNPAGK